MARTPTYRSNSDEETLERLAAPLRDAYVRQPEPGAERRHVAAMAATARQAPAAAPAIGTLARLRSRLAPTGRPGARRLVPAGVSTLAACVAFSGASAGLAVAGVSLPDPVKAPFNAVGVTLPNQADDAAREALEMSKPRSSESERSGGDTSRDARSRSVDPPGSRETGRERSQQGRDTARERSQQGQQRRSGAPAPGAPQGAPQGIPRRAPRGGGRPESAQPPSSPPAPAPAPRRSPREDPAPGINLPDPVPTPPGQEPGNRSQGGTK